MESQRPLTINDKIKAQGNDWSYFKNIWRNHSSDSINGEVFVAPNRSGTQTTKSVSVVIPAWNAGSTIMGCLASIENSTLHRKNPQSLQVIVVDDGSVDETWQLLTNYRGSVPVLALRQKNLGQTPAINTALAHANGEIIVCCDADMLLNVWALEELTLRHQYIDNIICVGFRGDVDSNSAILKSVQSNNDEHLRRHLFFLDNRFLFDEPGWPENMYVETNGFRDLGFGRKLWVSCNEFWDLPRMVYGCLFSITASDLEAIGGFDERLQGWGYSDTLIGAKARALGRYIIPIISASGWHVSHPYRTPTQPLEATYNSHRYNEIIEQPLQNTNNSLIAKVKERVTQWHDWQGTFSNCNYVYRPELTTISTEDSARLQTALGLYFEASNTWATCEANWRHTMERAKNLRWAGMPEAAEALLDEQSKQYYCSDVAVEWALSLAAINRFAEANSRLRQAYTLDAQNPLCRYILETPIQTHLERAKFYKEQGNFALARRDYQAVLIREPTHREALTSIE